MTIKEYLQSKQNIVLIIPNERYPDAVISIAKELLSLEGDFLYVSINKPCQDILKQLDKRQTEKFYCVDCISRSFSPSQATKIEQEKIAQRFYFIDNPHSLTQLGLGITKMLENKKIKQMLFDSISTLLIYNEEKEVMKFIHHVMSKVRETECRAVFTSLKEDVSSMLVKEITLFADAIIEYKETEKRKFGGPEIKDTQTKKKMEDFEEIKL
ncbi:MAG: hypothetical protein AB1467_05345 [Candidatus Diapherotrites archaeon]